MPPSARGVFGDRIGPATSYVSLLATAGVERGLIGPREVPRLWERHLLNCAVLGELVAPEATVADIGSGAGLPGLVLALCRPDLRVTLIEPLLRRSTFLEEAVALLGLDRVEVVRARAEELDGSREFDVVTSRALAPLPRLLDWSLPLVRPGGCILALKGRTADEEVAGVHAEARTVVTRIEVVRVGHAVIDPPATVVRVETSGTRPRTTVADTSSRPARRGTGRRRQSRGGRPRGNPGSGQ